MYILDILDIFSKWSLLIATKKHPLNCAIESVANTFMCQKSVFLEFLESFLRSEKWENSCMQYLAFGRWIQMQVNPPDYTRTTHWPFVRVADRIIDTWWISYFEWDFYHGTTQQFAMYYPCIYPMPSNVRCIYLHLVDLYTIYYADSMGIYTHIVCVRLLFSNSSSWSTTVRCDDKKSCLSLGGMWYIPKIAPENTRVIKLRILGVLNNTFPEASSLPLKIDHPKS